MKNILFLLFVSIGLLTSCVENPEENPDGVAPIGDLQVDFDGDHFTSATTTAVLDATSLSIKGTKADGSYFKIGVPTEPIIGTYTWDAFGPLEAGFSLEYHPAIGDPYVAARDDSGPFASFVDYTDTAQLVITNIDRVNKRISGTFKFTGVRFADVAQTGIATKVFTNGVFYSLPYTDTEVVIPGDDNVFVKKIVNSYPGAGIADQTDEFTYDGNKILTEVYTDSDGFVETTTYTYNANNLISEIESTDIDGLVERETFTYEGNKLVTYVDIDYWKDTSVKETYEHNIDGSILVTRFTGDLTSQLDPAGTSTIQFNDDGEVSSISFSTGGVKNYTYDNKKNPFKNVLGFDKIAFVNGESRGGALRNITQENTGGPLPTFTLTHTYNTTGNAIDYPATTSISSGVETDVVLTYTYQ